MRYYGRWRLPSGSAEGKTCTCTNFAAAYSILHRVVCLSTTPKRTLAVKSVVHWKSIGVSEVIWPSETSDYTVFYPGGYCLICTTVPLHCIQLWQPQQPNSWTCSAYRIYLTLPNLQIFLDWLWAGNECLYIWLPSFLNFSFSLFIAFPTAPVYVFFSSLLYIYIYTYMCFLFCFF